MLRLEQKLEEIRQILQLIFFQLARLNGEIKCFVSQFWQIKAIAPLLAEANN